LDPGMGDVRWSADDLAVLAAALPDHERTLTLWGVPDRAHIEALPATLGPLLRACGSTRAEADLEGAGRWRRKDVRGYRSLDDAGRALIAALRSAGAEHTSVTTFPGMLDAVSGALEGADELALQVYATTTSGHSPERTGRYLAAAIARYPHLAVTAGVAAYRQPGASDAERTAHMRRCLSEASRAGCSRVALWSAKHAVRFRSRAVVRAAIGEAVG